jgi:hypothetical protein
MAQQIKNRIVKKRQGELSVKLDLGKDDWYDMWHVHLDIFGKDPSKHREYIVEGLKVYQQIREQAANFGKPWQSWMLIDPEESLDDAIYFHTPNPNEDNFPLTFEEVEWRQELPPLLEGLIDVTQFDFGISLYEGYKMYWVKHKSQK